MAQPLAPRVVRRATSLATALALAVALGACGGSSSKSAATTTSAGTSSSAPAITTTTTSGSGTLPIAACGLLTSAEVAVLAGGAPGLGTELDHADTYKTCRWNVGANAVNVAVILEDAGSRGFVHSAGASSPVAVAGLGDAASFATEANGAELIAGKGRFSISLSVDGTGATGAQAAMIGDVRQVLSQLDP